MYELVGRGGQQEYVSHIHLYIHCDTDIIVGKMRRRADKSVLFIRFALLFFASGQASSVFRSARASCTTSGEPVCNENLGPTYTGIYAS